MADLDTLRGRATKATPGPRQLNGAGQLVLDDGPALFELPRRTKHYGPDHWFVAACDPQTILALLDENERLRAALTKLASEVEGVKARDIMVRGAIGNTNWGVLMLRLHEAREILAHP